MTFNHVTMVLVLSLASLWGGVALGEEVSGSDTLQTQFQQPEYQCPAGNSIESDASLGGTAFTISCEVPHDVTIQTTPYPEVSMADLATFAWQEFVALNFPADPNHRGQPMRGSNLGDAADARVWETYWHRVEVFPAPPGIPKMLNGAADVKRPPTYDYSSFVLDATTFGGELSQMNRHLWNNLDEDNELNVDQMFAHVSRDGINPTPVSGFEDANRIVFEAKMNEEGFNYILKKKLYDGDTRKTMKDASKTRQSIKDYAGSCGVTQDNIISLPCGQMGGPEGNIEIKAAWRRLDATETHSGKYYTNSVIRYQSVKKGTHNHWYTDTYGLIGLHIIHKTVNFPTYVFATFEHVDNIASGIGYVDEITQKGRGNGDKGGAKVVIKARDNPIPTAVQVVNTSAQLAIKETVWTNYKLIGVQAYPVDFNDLNKPKMHADKSTYFLANIVIESNEELQNFRGRKAASQKNEMNIYARGKDMNMGGCMGCHGVAALDGTDFNFLIRNAPFTSPEVVGGSGVIDLRLIHNWEDVKKMLTDFVSLNPVNIQGSPHKAFWEDMSYTEFTTGPVPGLQALDTTKHNTPVQIVDCTGNKSSTSNIVLILKEYLTAHRIQEMPQGGPYFPEEQVANFAKWVDDKCPK